MSIAKIAVEKKTITTFTTFIFLLGGIASYFGMGQLEDPEFTVKTAVVMTPYPGARADEVELEVTDRIELALQEMPQLKNIESYSRAGFSQVTVDILPEYTSSKLPQVWDELRKKIRDITSELPPGAGKPVILDDFGDVYGFLLAVVGDGYTYAELERFVDHIKKELSLVKGVARVDLWGEQGECVYLDVAQSRLSQLGLARQDIESTLVTQNMVVDSGGIDVVDERLRIETTGEFTSPEDIGELVLHDRRLEELGGERRLTRVSDVATVRRGYLEPPTWEMRFDGHPAIGVYASNVSGANIVEIGAAMDARLDELEAELPVGIEVRRISWQSDLVSESIVNFMINLAEAIAIVMIVLWAAMGFRTAVVVGMSGLLFTIVISFMIMKLFDIDLQRMSLGALIIAMGMMVDNAIVVADGVLVRMQRGVNRVQAAIEAATQPSIPLLAATVIAVMAFYPIAASNESAGEYCATLFSVAGISLMLSWVLAVTVAPVMCIAMLPEPKGGADAADPYGGRFYMLFRRVLEKAMRFRWPVMLVLFVMLVGAGACFRWVPQMFFPAAARTQFMLDYWAPEGTRIQQVSADLRPIEEMLLADERVTAVTTFIGQGPPRFYLPVDPESSYPSYGQLIVNTRDFKAVKELLPELQSWADANVPQAQLILRKYGLGPYESWPVEARFSGPAIADPDTLRSLAAEAKAIMEASPHALQVRTNWRQKTKKVVADYDQNNARWTLIQRGDIATATQRAYDGVPLGLYRERDKLLPIVLRHVEDERMRFATTMETLQVRPPLALESVPLSQVTSSIDVEWEDPMIWRWDRRRAITVQGVPRELATVLRADVIAGIESITLPPGYTLEWDGEFRSSTDAQQSLIPGMIPAAIVVALIIVALFNSYRPPLIIVCVIPFAMIGVTVGLLVTRQPFGFVALLGAMSLCGMMIKNAIVLLDQVNIEIADGKDAYTAVVDSAVSRLRPVMLAAGTTVLGVIPLLQDVFWISMAVVIMFGLALGSLLTVVVVPVLYAIFYRLEAPGKA